MLKNHWNCCAGRGDTREDTEDTLEVLYMCSIEDLFYSLELVCLFQSLRFEEAASFSDLMYCALSYP